MYDYVIVGAGSAGCVLANRLSEDADARVCLIEAGPADASDLIHIPAAFSALFRSRYDWDLATHYEPNLGDRRVYLPRGRTLGGSSSINAMVYIRGNRADYDEWRDAYGCTGWGYADLLPYFKLSEDNERGASDYHGAGGPLAVSDRRSGNAMSEAFVEAALAAGMAPNDDFNGAEQDGAGIYQVTQRNGMRASAAAGYLHPVRDRPNLDVLTNTQVTRIQFEGGRAVGVEAVHADEALSFRAQREVILCAGAYLSPQLLTLSGIGRPAELAPMLIPVVAESHGVGIGLQDHLNAGASFTTDREDSLFGALNDENLARLQATGDGPLTSNIAEAGGFLRSRDDLDAPDLQLHFAPAIFAEEGLSPGQAHGLSLGACILKPLSRGQVVVVSPDPTAKPLIVHNYLAEPADRAAMIAGVRRVMEIFATAPLAAMTAEQVSGPEALTDDAILAAVSSRAQTLYHPTSTCAMGVSETSVCDLQLRVRGVEALRVVDASVMPSVPRGNTNAPVIALAERAADLIRGRDPLPAEDPASARPAVA